MKFSLSLLLLTAVVVSSCDSVDEAPRNAQQRAARYPADTRPQQYPPQQQPFNPNGPAQPENASGDQGQTAPSQPAAPTKVAKGDFPYGICALRGFLPSDDCMHTVNALRALGIQIDQPEPTELVVHGKKRVLNPPAGEIDCGNSGTSMRLLAGLLAGQTFESRLVGDAGLSRRPMDRGIAPLSRMVANILAEGPEHTPPLRIRCGSFR